jgi:hypothetical protein
MIAVGMGDENMRDGLAAHGVEQRRAVHGIFRTRIDDGDLAAADDVAHRALEGERAWVVAQHAPHAGHRLIDASGNELEVFVVGDVRRVFLGHRLSYRHSRVAGNMWEHDQQSQATVPRSISPMPKRAIASD